MLSFDDADKIASLVNQTIAKNINAISTDHWIDLDKNLIGHIEAKNITVSGLTVTGYIDMTTFDFDTVVDGTVYKKVKGTEVIAGVIHLYSGTIKDGAWYSEAGVSIDADNGIYIYGGGGDHTVEITNTDIVMKSDTGRFELSSSGMVGWNHRSSELDTYKQVELRTTDGRIYAAGGDVIIDANGIKVALLNSVTFYSDIDGSMSTLVGNIGYFGNVFLQATGVGLTLGSTTDDIYLVPGDAKEVVVWKSIVPQTSSVDCGTTADPWGEVHAVEFYGGGGGLTGVGGTVADEDVTLGDGFVINLIPDGTRLIGNNGSGEQWASVHTGMVYLYQGGTVRGSIWGSAGDDVTLAANDYVILNGGDGVIVSDTGDRLGFFGTTGQTKQSLTNIGSYGSIAGSDTVSEYAVSVMIADLRNKLEEIQDMVAAYGLATVS